MWTTAKLVNKEMQLDGNVLLTIVFGRNDSSEEVKVQQLVNFTDSDPDFLKNVAIRELQRLNSVTNYEKVLQIGDIDLSIIQDDVKNSKNAYNAKRSELVFHKQDLNLGLITQDEYDSFLKEVLALK